MKVTRVDEHKVSIPKMDPGTVFMYGGSVLMKIEEVEASVCEAARVYDPETYKFNAVSLEDGALWYFAPHEKATPMAITAMDITSIAEK